MDQAQVPSEQQTPSGSRLELPSTSLGIVCTLHAIPLGWAAVMFPWRPVSWFTIVIGALAIAHAVVAALAFARRKRSLVVAWQVLAAYSLLVLVGMTWVIVGSALYLSELYRGIGHAISAGLFGVWGVIALLTVPVSAWALARTPLPAWARRLRARKVAGVFLIVTAAACFAVARSARAAERGHAHEPMTEPSLAKAARELTRRADAVSGAADQSESLFHEAPVTCNAPIDGEGNTLLLTARGLDGVPFSACVQGADAGGVIAKLRHVVLERAAPASSLKLDWITGVRVIHRSHPLLDALKARPALDGVCSRNRCLAPWQLVALDAFTHYRPLEAVRDASFGASLDHLASLLGVDARETMFRIETRSWVAKAGALHPLRRLRQPRGSVDAAALKEATVAAERHIVAAQLEDGAFRYTLDPFRGSADDGSSVNLPRQAGTTLVLCELGKGRRTRATVRRVLAQLAQFERPTRDRAALSVSDSRAQLGHTALPLIAFVTCRPWARDEHDALIGRMARFVLGMQRENGSFHPEFHLRSDAPRGDHEPLYAAGQAVFALVLVEQLAASEPHPELPSRDVLHRAVQRAMDHYSSSYWPAPLRSLFYLEENWHCLAARAALESHRHDGYERFCLDYVGFKSRLILAGSFGVAPEHVGGYSLSNMLPPHSTATAGFGEALAAAIAVKHARGLDVGEDQDLMRRVLGFLLEHQWNDVSCFACSPNREALGGFSETSASPVIRIDYVQHAMAALGHGSRALGLGKR